MRQSTSGRVAWATTSPNIDLPSQAANLVTENAQAAPALVRAGDTFLPRPQGAYATGLFYSHARTTAVGSGVIGVANSTVAGIDPASTAYNLMGMRSNIGAIPIYLRASQSGRLSVARAGVVNVDAGSIATKANGLVNISASVPDAVSGDCVVASPRTALTAGIAFSHVFIAGGGAVNVVLHNLTAGAVDPAAVDFDFVLLKALDAGGRAVRASPSGLICIQSFIVSIDFPSIAALTVVEAAAAFVPIGKSIPVPNTANNRLPVVTATPNAAALPAGLAISHARISATNTVSIGLANVTANPIDPAAISFVVTTFFLPER